jgi:hypothetical protein
MGQRWTRWKPAEKYWRHWGAMNGAGAESLIQVSVVWWLFVSCEDVSSLMPRHWQWPGEPLFCSLSTPDTITRSTLLLLIFPVNELFSISDFFHLMGSDNIKDRR